jgi:peptidoglycan/LPS O-acetylase OafA/YrhL
MNRSFSVYLDLVRVVSALMVVLYHSTCACSARTSSTSATTGTPP